MNDTFDNENQNNSGQLNDNVGQDVSGNSKRVLMIGNHRQNIFNQKRISFMLKIKL